jgi:hypothetical protein
MRISTTGSALDVSPARAVTYRDDARNGGRAEENDHDQLGGQRHRRETCREEQRHADQRQQRFGQRQLAARRHPCHAIASSA